MRRREFIAGIVAAAAGPSWPARAQTQVTGRRRVGVLRYSDPNDPEDQALLAAFTQQLQTLGWRDGDNVEIDTLWASDRSKLHGVAAQLIARRPEVIVAGSAAARPAMEETHDRPIVFVNVNDPIRLGLVRDLAHPGGNVTGFYNYDLGMAGKWMEILREIAPNVTRVFVLGSRDIPSFEGWVHAAEDFARSEGIEVVSPALHSAADLEQAMDDAGSKPATGALVLAGGLVSLYKEVIIDAAARFRIPVIYPRPAYSKAGGLLSYGIDIADMYRRAATYVDRILKGANPGELPVQGPSKFELVINMKTAGELGLEVPQRLRLLADQLIR